MRSLWRFLTKPKVEPDCEAQEDAAQSSKTGTQEAKRTVFAPLPHICAITDTCGSGTTMRMRIAFLPIIDGSLSQMGWEDMRPAKWPPLWQSKH